MERNYYATQSSGFYYATFEETCSLMQENLELEREIERLENCKNAFPIKIPRMKVFDKYFGCDVLYGKLLSRNSELKHNVKSFFTPRN